KLMSYILDALKKSEQDRGNGSIPNVQTIHSSALNYHQEKRALWPWVLIAVLMFNVFILIYFLKPETDTQNIAPSLNTEINNHEATDKNIATVISMPSPVPIVTETQPISTPVSEQATSEQNNNSIEIAAPEISKSLVTIDELPANIRQQIPNMIFSAHVYSSAPMQRSLVINDRFMEEGDAVGYDLVLVEITRNGAIFDFRGHLFSTSVLSGWGNP
ncbi:MAG: general secretion pathway protein GspB, partial [Gammaproteobacteria bacterium]|nr:general secretion pathway protein GspB [Gammaproteobacteria bacterium]